LNLLLTVVEKKRLARIMLYLAPRYATKQGRWQLSSMRMAAKAKELLTALNSLICVFEAPCLMSVFKRWREERKREWQSVQAKAKRVGWERHFKDLVGYYKLAML